MAQKPVSENTDIPDERSEARNPDPLATGNYTLEMGLKPKLQNNIYDGISIDQFATKKDIQPLEKNIQSLEKNIQSLDNDIKSLEKDIKSIEKDIKDQKENTDIKFSAVNSRIDSLRNEMNTNFECLKNEMNAKFEKMEAKFEKMEAKFESLEAKFVSLRSEMNAKFESLRSEMNTKFESLDIKLDGHKKDIQNTMYKSLALAIGGFAACIAIIQYFFG